jgi:transposase InsO family protein
MVLAERSVVEQRYEAVQQVLRDGVPVTEVAERLGVSRQSVHAWVRRYQAGGLAGLTDRSHRPKGCPHQTVSEVEAAVCELRRAHPRWGPQRLRHELLRRGRVQVPSRASIYRILVRRGLLEPGAKRKRDYRRWERDAPMQLWQIDIMGEVWLVDGTELKLVTGIDDHSRYCVLAQLVERATARAVCAAFAGAMRRHGVPEEVLTDNGKQFTGRFTKPRPAEVLFERILRENGVAQRLAQPRSPTTTGKIERFHKTLRDELLDDQGPFQTVEAAQAAIDRWVAGYNAERPHQSLGMATPAGRFVPDRGQRETVGQLALRVPDDLADPPAVSAVQLEVVVPPSGNLWLAGRQLWVGPRLAGRTVGVWADSTSIHLLLDGVLLKTLPSRFTAAELDRLHRHPAARPAGPAPRVPAAQPATLTSRDAVEVDRLVNAAGLVGLANRQLSVGTPLAGRRITLRVEAAVVHVIADGVLVRTLPSPVAPAARARLQGARLASEPLPAPTGPEIVQRILSSRGSCQVAGHRLHVGLPHAGKTVTIAVHSSRFDVLHNGAPLRSFPRTGPDEITRRKAYDRKNNNQTVSTITRG